MAKLFPSLKKPVIRTLTQGNSLNEFKERELWESIRLASNVDPALKEMVEALKTFYILSKK